MNESEPTDPPVDPDQERMPFWLSPVVVEPGVTKPPMLVQCGTIEQPSELVCVELQQLPQDLLIGNRDAYELNLHDHTPEASTISRAAPTTTTVRQRQLGFPRLTDTLIADLRVLRRGCRHVGIENEEKLHTPAYRREAAHLVIETGRPIVQVAREIGVGEALLGRWVAVERAETDRPREALDADERAELARLRTENAELRKDREFLKKAAAFFATEHQNR